VRLRRERDEAYRSPNDWTGFEEVPRLGSPSIRRRFAKEGMNSCGSAAQRETWTAAAAGCGGDGGAWIAPTLFGNIPAAPVAECGGASLV